jgi:hypothetical protein
MPPTDVVQLSRTTEAGLVAATFGHAPEAWRRMLGITLDGLRAPGDVDATRFRAAWVRHALATLIR